MGSLTATQVFAFLYATATQILGVSLLVKARGFTHLGYTLASIAVLVSSFFALSWLLANGAKLNILLPILAATVPLGSIMVGAILFGEPVSWSKLAMLVAACVLIGLATAFD